MYLLPQYKRMDRVTLYSEIRSAGNNRKRHEYDAQISSWKNEEQPHEGIKNIFAGKREI